MNKRLRIIGAVVVVALLLAGAVALFARGHDVFGLSFAGGGGATTTDWFGPATFDGKPLTCEAFTSENEYGQPIPLGVPAITPHVAHPGPQQAAYSVADLRAYLLKLPSDPSEHVTIYSIQLMNAVHAAALSQGECTGLPDAAAVYLVTLHGDFPAVVGPPLSGTPRPTPPPTHVGTIVYDAHTGNLIMAGNMGR